MIAAGLIRPFIFPDPGKPEGIRTFRKPIMTLKDINFKYPETEKYVVEKCTATLTLGSRAVIVGGNGSGKSTVLKLLIGDLEGEEGKGEAWKHHNLRQAYVAQQSLHHLEDFVQVTPVHYIQERFRQGLDAELGKLKTTLITEEDQAAMKEPGAVYEVVGRTQKGKNMWYADCPRHGPTPCDPFATTGHLPWDPTPEQCLCAAAVLSNQRRTAAFAPLTRTPWAVSRALWAASRRRH